MPNRPMKLRSAVNASARTVIAGLLLSGLNTPVLADDLPAVIDDKQPTTSPQLRDALDIPLDREGAEVNLPDAQEGLDAETVIPVSHIKFLGGSVFDLELLAQDLKHLVGKEARLADLALAARKITQRYQEAGYPLSYAYLPENNFADGVVTIVIVEGHIVRTEIEIENEAVAERVADLADRLIGEVPLTRATFERYTQLMERIPGAKLTMRAPVPRTANGATTLRVEEKEIERFGFGGSLDGGDEDDFLLLANVSTQGHTPFGEQLSLAALAPIEDEEYYAAEYQQEIGTDGLRITLNANRFEGEDDDQVFVLGQAINVNEDKVRNKYHIGLAYPLILRREKTWNVAGGIDYYDEESNYTFSLPGQPSVRAQQELRYTAAELNSALRLISRKRLVELSGEIRQGVDLGENRNTVSLGGVTSQQAEDTEFTRLAANSRWAEQIAERWRVTARAAGFWSNDRLPSPERGNYGGARFGRAYPDGQAEGDYGYAGDVELRYIQPLGIAWLQTFEPYVLADTAHTRFNDISIEHDLTSAVIGFDISDTKHYRLGIEYAYPLGDADIETGSRDGRINIRLSWNFNT